MTAMHPVLRLGRSLALAVLSLAWASTAAAQPPQWGALRVSRTDSTERILGGGDRPQWFTGSFLPDSITMSLPGRDIRTCDDVVVHFLSLTPVSSTDPNNRILAPVWDSAGGCLVRFRWRLGDAAGDQILQVRVVKGNTVPLGAGAGPATTLHVIAHVPPYLFLGAAYLTGKVPIGGSDTSQVDPIIGLDIPLLLLKRAWWPKPVRLMLATSVKHFGSDLQVGLAWFPLLAGPAGESFAVQGYSGYSFGLTSGQPSTWIVFALAFNAGSALGTALGVLTK